MTDALALDIARREMQSSEAFAHIAARLREPAEAQAQGGGEVWPASVRDEALEVLRSVDTQLGATGQKSARVERLVNLIAGLPASAPPSAPVGVDEAAEDAAAIDKAWGRFKAALAQQPAPSAPVGVDEPPKGWNPCSRCRLKGKSDGCERCGGSGWRKRCNALDCLEYGCNGYGFCIVTKDELAAALDQQPAAEPYKALFVAAMNTAEQAMDYVQNNSDKFDARPGDDKLAIVCREFLKAQQPSVVDGAMVHRALAAYEEVRWTGRPESPPPPRHVEAMRAALTAALAAQPGGSGHD